MIVTDFHDTRAPGFPGDTLRYEIGYDGTHWHWRRAGGRWCGPCDTYDDALDCVLAVESAAGD